MSETYRLLRSGAQQLRRAANCFEAIKGKRGDDANNTLAKLIASQRQTAEFLEARAKEVGPSTEIERWNRGTKTAMKNLPAIQAGNPA